MAQEKILTQDQLDELVGKYYHWYSTLSVRSLCFKIEKIEDRNIHHYELICSSQNREKHSVIVNKKIVYKLYHSRSAVSNYTKFGEQYCSFFAITGDPHLELYKGTRHIY